MTLYPSDEEELTVTLQTLAAELEGFVGPYILGDLRYAKGPLFVRYGAFEKMWCHDGQ
jgi:hypothetical protein